MSNEKEQLQTNLKDLQLKLESTTVIYFHLYCKSFLYVINI